jgi:hypothetical protein
MLISFYFYFFVVDVIFKIICNVDTKIVEAWKEKAGISISISILSSVHRLIVFIIVTCVLILMVVLVDDQ